MRTAADIRKENCKYILETQFQGVKNRMAKACDIPHMQIARIFFENEARRNCGDKLARRIETALGLELGWLDQDHAKTDLIMTKIATLNAEGRRAVEGVVDALIMRYKE